MTTLNKLNLFLIDEHIQYNKKHKSLAILENLFKYPQPVTGLEAQIYLKNIFDDEFNSFIKKLNEHSDVRQYIAAWIYKNYFDEIVNETHETITQKKLDWNAAKKSQLKKLITKFLSNEI